MLILGRTAGFGKKEEGFFFFEKKKQKTFGLWVLANAARFGRQPRIKVVLLLFLQKKKTLP
jgi:hypothetical protein